MSLSIASLLAALPGCLAQGIIWGIMALGLYITYRLLDFADLTVDGSFATGGAVTVMLILRGLPAPAGSLHVPRPIVLNRNFFFCSGACKAEHKKTALASL